jgi:hypothetical protein
MSKTFVEVRQPEAPVLEPEVRPAEAPAESEAEPDGAAVGPEIEPMMPDVIEAVASGAEAAAAEAEIEESLAEPEVAEGSQESDPTAPGMEHVGDAEVDEILSEPEVIEAGAETEPATQGVESMGDADIEEILSEPEEAAAAEADAGVSPTSGTEADIEEALSEPESLSGGPDIPPEEAARLAAEVTGITEMTVDDLQAACEEDGAEAEAQLMGTTMRITGTVSTVVAGGASEDPSVVLSGAGAESAREVICVFDGEEAEALSGLRKGQPVTVQGTFDSCEDSILMMDCSLVG